MKRIVLALVLVVLAACGVDKKATENQAEATAYLTKNGKAKGVVTLPSGLQYKIERSGPTGGQKPQPGDEVKVHYEGKLLSGKVFDSSYERGAPAAMPIDALIPAWIEALQLMRPGDSWTLYVPPALGYGEEGAGGGEIRVRGHLSMGVARLANPRLQCLFCC